MGSVTPSNRLTLIKSGAVRAIRRRRHYGVEKVPWFFLAPALFLYIFIVLYPAGSGVVYAFTDWDGWTLRASFVGLANFNRLFQDPQALAALEHVLMLATVITLVQTAVGLALALGVNAQLKTRHALRVIFFAPVVFVPLVVAYIWQYLLTPDGPINAILGGVGLSGLEQTWLGDPNLALWSIALISIWQNVGFSMTIFIAGLQGVPAELIEAANLDGAGPWRRLWAVTFPLLAPATTINVVLTLMGSLKLFDQVYGTTGGGPGYATETLATFLFKEGFLNSHYGYGSAIGLAMTALVFVISLVVVTILRRYEEVT
jgi:raffinose/stachyose/melibiose transport system permease protein